jgi:hypothetical protein
MREETGGGVSEKQKHFDPNRRYNGPLQKREKKNGRNKNWHDVATMRYGHGNEYKNCMMTIAVNVLVDWIEHKVKGNRYNAQRWTRKKRCRKRKKTYEAMIIGGRKE